MSRFSIAPAGVSRAGRARGRASLYPGSMPGEHPTVKPQVDELRRLLEQELDAAVPSHRGCWPLVVAVAGVLLAVALLVKLL